MTFGLTDLFDKADGEDPKISGWGFELTMRVPVTSDQPPAWVLDLIEKLARYVYHSGQPFAHGHRMEPGGPITGRSDTRLTAVAFATDPQLPRITSQNGSSIFLTVVGISAEELARMKETTTDAVLDELVEVSPLYVTDVGR